MPGFASTATDASGEALGLVPSLRPDIGTIDGIVLTSAWLRGDTIYTSDVADLRAIQSRVPAFAALTIRAA